MLKDKHGTLIYQEQDIFELLYRGKIDLLDKIIVEQTAETLQIPNLNFYQDNLESLEIFDNNRTSKWFIPEEYKSIDIEHYVLKLCPPWDPDYTRVQEELLEFEKRNMLDLLKWLKYFIDTARKNNVLWGVGRGSSVSSYVLYLIGVHKINSLKYNLDYKEFFR